jgi:hypothetical protein
MLLYLSSGLFFTADAHLHWTSVLNPGKEGVGSAIEDEGPELQVEKRSAQKERLTAQATRD